jgi:hypothetical protein
VIDEAQLSGGAVTVLDTAGPVRDHVGESAKEREKLPRLTPERVRLICYQVVHR